MQGREGQEAQEAAQSIIISDPPLHTRLRRLVGQAFTARSLSEMESRMRKITGELLDGLLESVRPGDTFDLVEKFSSPLPKSLGCRHRCTRRSGDGRTP